ncbi:MAG: glycosyltransferase family 4 protein [Bacteroidaceae bacterium]|nr:glycosyltransferase family 4 protein [Bacteroidaceae bacterium]
MKILFVCQYFYPEVFRGNDIAFHWAEEGHEVHVVCGVPNYPKGKFFEGYGWFKKRRETLFNDNHNDNDNANDNVNHNGGVLKVTRLPIVPRGNGKVTLMLNYFSYLVVAWVWMLFHAFGHRYDRVFVQQLSPVMMSAPGVLYKRLRKVPLYTWVLDLWPESLTAAGGINNKYVLGFFRHFVKSEYRHSDKILISSRSFERSVLEYGDYKEKIVYYPQWSDGSDSGELKDESLESVKQVESSGVLKSGFKLMFAGAVGEAHGFDCTMQAALLTKEQKDIKWIIVGDGRRLDWVKQFVKDNGLEETVFTLGRFPAETMPWFFKQADVMLVTLSDDPLFRLYAPAKISSYMAAGKPIVAVLNGEGAEVIRDADCGWTLAAGDAEGFARLAVELSQMDKAVLEEKGRNALNYYNAHYVKKKCLSRLDDLMTMKG